MQHCMLELQDAQTNKFTHLGLKSVKEQSIGHSEPVLLTLYLILPAIERVQTQESKFKFA